MVGKTILHYKILEKLGEGGMGVVYKALDTKLNREVAIKFLPHHIAPGEEERERFKIEAQAAAALNHPNIATIHAVEEVEGETFIVMEYIKGRELKDIVASNLPQVHDLREVLDYATQVADGLQAAHEEGVIHRDIKSANIMITEKGQVKIMDFGLAKVRGGDELTKEHSTLGTAAYMSPEQAIGKKDIDHRTDIWSFGVVLYEMLTGQLPFQGEYDSAIMYAIMNEKPESIKEKRADVPIEIENVIVKCLQKDRENRYPNCSEILNDLKKLTRASGSEEIATPMKRTQKKSKGFRAVINIVAGLSSILLALFIFTSIFQKKLNNPRIVNIRPLFASTAVLEIAPKFSPDGTRVLYDSDQAGNLDIWVMQLASGAKRNLTEDYNGRDGAPVWSPDGEFIAFASSREGGGIFVTSEFGGTVRRVVSLTSKDFIRALSWSPDGEKIAYNLAGKIYIVPAEGGKPAEVNLPHSVRLGPTWFPNSDRLAYVPYEQVWSAGLDGSDPKLMLDKPGLLFPSTWSGDGKRIFFKWNQGGMRDIWWAAADKSGNLKGEIQRLSTGLNIGNFSISSDGLKLIYTTIDYQHNIYSLPIHKNRALSLADAKPITNEKWYMGKGGSLAISPDFEWISFNTWRGGHAQIWIVQKNGKNLRQVTDDSTAKWGGRWEPDGEHIAYSSYGNMYEISIKGEPATPMMLPDTADQSWFSWSPDKKKIAFMSNRTGNLDVWLMPASGGEAVPLTTHKAQDYCPLWSPDGNVIIFGSDRSGSYEIYLYSIATGEIRKLTSVHSPDYIGYDWSPNGKKIYINYQPGENQFIRTISEISVRDGSMRTIFESKINTFQDQLGRGIITDGEYVFFMKEHQGGESWIADLVYE
jgi:serine/threonine protein kinase